MGKLLRWLGEFIRYSLVSFGGFVLDIGALVALRTLTPLPLAVDAAVAFALAAVFSFALTRQWVFPDARSGRPQADFARYMVLITAGLLVTTAVVAGLAGLGLDYRLAKLGASGLVGLLNFFIMPRWVLRRGAGRPAPVAAVRAGTAPRP
jgi:putative flippase GtrA